MSVVTFRVSNEEKTAIEQAAKAAGQSVSDYLRDCARGESLDGKLARWKSEIDFRLGQMEQRQQAQFGAMLRELKATEEQAMGVLVQEASKSFGEFLAVLR